MKTKCLRKNCEFYSKSMDNNCVALHTIYQNAYECKFHKIAISNKASKNKTFI